ncbi:hypothetical protein JFU57_20255 [Pseudomonas sp. TH07]|uniref:hypothetical protein n=1 Tax=Pseudomonas sp. TH07 TaxID=2796373 RepID=UPI0019121FDB|nr:hypothetical protein [Pseudomonas sp. TH07]MBK5540611.1 hypothetical protein [Pseudomonas sp. TH07]
MDGVQYSFAANRAATRGDSEAESDYRLAASVSMITVLPAVYGALAGSALLGPIGLALILGLIAYAVATRAKKKESSLLEIWARRCLWGLPKSHRRWKGPEDLDNAVGELNASVLGVTADLSINLRPVRESDIKAAGEDYAAYAEIRPVPYGYFLEYRISLPEYDSALSDYTWSMKVYRPGMDGLVIAAGNNNSPATATEAPPPLKRTDYKTETTRPAISSNETASTLTISGAIWFYDNHDMHAVDLEVSFWPDRSDESGVARLIALEDKTDILKKGK